MFSSPVGSINRKEVRSKKSGVRSRRSEERIDQTFLDGFSLNSGTSYVSRLTSYDAFTSSSPVESKKKTRREKNKYIQKIKERDLKEIIGITEGTVYEQLRQLDPQRFLNIISGSNEVKELLHYVDDQLKGKGARHIIEINENNPELFCLDPQINIYRLFARGI